MADEQEERQPKEHTNVVQEVMITKLIDIIRNTFRIMTDYFYL